MTLREDMQELVRRHPPRIMQAGWFSVSFFFDHGREHWDVHETIGIDDLGTELRRVAEKNGIPIERVRVARMEWTSGGNELSWQPQKL